MTKRYLCDRCSSSDPNHLCVGNALRPITSTDTKIEDLLGKLEFVPPDAKDAPLGLYDKKELITALKTLLTSEKNKALVEELERWFATTGHPAQYIGEEDRHMSVRAKTSDRVVSVTLPKEFYRAIKDRLAELKEK